MNNIKSIIIIVLLNSITAIGMEIVTHQAPLKKQSVNEFFGIPTITINSAKEEEKIKKKIGMDFLNRRRWWYIETLSSYNKMLNPPTKPMTAMYERWTLEQLLLKRILHTWLLVEKPDKNIFFYKLLLGDIAEKFKLNKKQLTRIWKTLPDYMQSALWESLHKKIQRHGKTTHNYMLLAKNIF